MRKCDPPFFTQVSVSCSGPVSQRIFHHASDTDVEGAELVVWILVAYAPFKGAHRLLRADRFGPYEIRDFEVEGNILPKKC